MKFYRVDEEILDRTQKIMGEDFMKILEKVKKTFKKIQEKFTDILEKIYLYGNLEEILEMWDIRRRFWESFDTCLGRVRGQ